MADLLTYFTRIVIDALNTFPAESHAFTVTECEPRLMVTYVFILAVPIEYFAVPST
jgi:hypothetical protein